MQSDTRPGPGARMRARLLGAPARVTQAWRRLPAQRRSTVLTLILLGGLLGGLLAVQRPSRIPEVPWPPDTPLFAPPAALPAPGPAAQPQAAAGPQGTEPATPAAGTGAQAEPPAPALDTAPLEWPVQGQVLLGFQWANFPGSTSWRLHDGLDVAALPGEPVVAAAAGTFAAVETDPVLGQVVTLDHGGGRMTRYANVEQITLRPGDPVARAQVIGRVGTPGAGEGNAHGHLHFAVVIGGEPVDPMPHLAR